MKRKHFFMLHTHFGQHHQPSLRQHHRYGHHFRRSNNISLNIRTEKLKLLEECQNRKAYGMSWICRFARVYGRMWMEVNVGLWKIFISLSMWLALFVGWPVCLSSVIFPLLCFWVYVYVCVFLTFCLNFI